VKRVLAALLALGLWATGALRAADVVSPELEPGDRGTLLTTLDGTEPEEIPVRYLGTYRNFAGPGQDLYVVQMEGPEAERVGAASGMSGSPVYFDGRLIGALSYRLGVLPKEPIAGITPIESMLDASRAVGSSPGDGTTVRPIATPVYIGGLARPVREWVTPRLEEIGFVTVTGGGIMDAATLPGKLVPGGAVGVELVRGDLSMGASGTVTLIDGDVVYAFGHPFLGSGRVELPMAPAEVIHVLADLAGSFHMVNIGSSVGAILEDRQAAVVGRLGHQARLIPIDIRVRGGDYGEQKFHYDVVAGSQLTPLLAGVVTANSLLTSNGYTEKTTILARGLVRLKDLPELPLEMSFSSSQGIDPGLALASSLYSTLQTLWDNPLEEVEVERLRLEVEVRAEPISYRVESLHYDRGALESGETLEVRCVLREHRGEQVTREFSLTLPDNLPRRGSLILAVGNPAGLDLALGDTLGHRLASARDLHTVIDALALRRSAHRLTAVVYEPGGAVVTRGVAFAELPPTAEKLLSIDRPYDPRKARPLVSTLSRAEIELDGPVAGGKQVRLKIERGHPEEERR